MATGESFVKEKSATYGVDITANANVKYDLVGKLVDETGLTRKAIIAILQGIQPVVFNQFRENPEEFIVKAANLINEEKAIRRYLQRAFVPGFFCLLKTAK